MKVHTINGTCYVKCIDVNALEKMNMELSDTNAGLRIEIATLRNAYESNLENMVTANDELISKCENLTDNLEMANSEIEKGKELVRKVFYKITEW